ncbi:MAG: ABC transporter ATP-binding protein [Mobilicoccus sp.]|nr:ABC transporter ATP-binding protein [Mobilicoccus sp.]
MTPTAGLALLALFVGSIGAAIGTVIAGQLAEGVRVELVGWFALAVVGGACLDTVGRVLWAGGADRAEGRLRADLLDAALDQPLATLTEQAVGEVLDRVDDDTREVGSLVRLQVWMMLRAILTGLPLLVVAAITWWPGAIIFPLVTAVTLWSIKALLPEIAARKVVEEAAWTDHAAVLEEGVAGRDDIRTSLGQAFAIGRLTTLSADVHAKFRRVLVMERRVVLRSGLILHALLAGTAVVGAALVITGGLSIAQLVTLFLVTSTFVGLIGHVAEQLPELQAGMGAVIRLRQMIASPAEPVGGVTLPEHGLDLEFRDLDFSYEHGSFALADVNLHVPAGQTMALVGRTGSGKSTLAALISRAVEPPPGTLFLGGVDVREVDLLDLRRAVGVVTQRTEILAGTLADNISLFADVPRERVEAVVAELGLTEWVAGLDEGLDTPLGAGGTTLSAGEEQLLAFARLLIRDVDVVVLDEATARMDPLTEGRVVAASERLLAGRTGILIAHRLTTIARADYVTVLADGRVAQTGPYGELATRDGQFRDLLLAAGLEDTELSQPAPATPAADEAIGTSRRRGEVLPRPDPGSGPSLARGIASAMLVRPQWGVLSIGLFLIFGLTGALGAVTGYAWGHTVESLTEGGRPWWWIALVVASALISPVMLGAGVMRYPRWWVEVLLRVRMSVLVGQSGQRRLDPAPPGEVVARALDSDRYARYADRWVDFINGLLIAGFTAVAAGTPLAGLVLLGVMVAAGLASALGRPIAGRSAAAASAARAQFGRMLVSVLDGARTVKLAGRMPQVRAHLLRVDQVRVDAAVREHRVQSALDGVPTIMVQLGIVVAWSAVLWGWWGLATALLLTSAVGGFDWFGRVAGSVVTEAPGTRAWQVATARMAGGVDLMAVPEGVDLLTGTAPDPPVVPRASLQRLSLAGLSAVHEDGTIGVEDVDLEVERGELVLLLGQIGSGKSSLLRSLAGLVDHRGTVQWNGIDVEDPELFLRPGQVAYVSQVPRVLSGTFDDNVRLGFDRVFDGPVDDARLSTDVAAAGGPGSMVGHRGVRLSGGQVQRLALARALAADAELLLADDVSSALDAKTEIDLWQALRARSATVIGATSKRAALAQADRVVVLVDGRIAAVGPWEALEPAWGHLAG